MLNLGIRPILALILALQLAWPAHAAEMCASIFGGSVQTKFFGLESSAGQYHTPEALAKYQENTAALAKVLKRVPEPQRENIEHILIATEFFDYTHMAAELVPNFLGSYRKAFKFDNLYDSFGEKQGAIAFKGFVAARNYLSKKNRPVTAKLLSEIHKLAMAEGVEEVAPEQLGIFRNARWGGNAYGDHALAPGEVEIINSNPYLYFVKDGTETAKPDANVWNKISVWASSKSTKPTVAEKSLVTGTIMYPNVFTPKIETVELIKNSSPQVYAEIMALRARQAKGENLTYSSPEVEATESRFTEALVQQRLERFNQERNALGKVSIGKNERDYISIVADLQRDLVAIHPLLNGNGRSTRLFMNYLLSLEGLPPVRLVDPMLDIQVSREDWREYVHKAVINNAKMYADILTRVQNGLTPEYSPELLFPGLPEQVSIALKKQGTSQTKENYKKVEVEPDQFTAFLQTMFETYPDLEIQLKNNHIETMNRLAELFVEFFRSKTIDYIHQKDGEDIIKLRLVDSDFIKNFDVTRAYDKTLWQNKMNRWYDRKMLIWRGLSGRNEVSDAEILTYFTRPSSRIVSNAAVVKLRNGEPLRTAIIEDFEQYNRELINGQLIEMANDHHKEGPRYRTSYGYSTSKREVVGKAFAMGAMVIAEYGKQNDPALQQQLKSRINIASYRAEKDVDLGRLKAFDPEFSYIYGRQAEVMAIGGTDPDAVMLIQRLDATGEVTTTFYRNPELPSEVLEIRGRYVPGEGPLAPEKIVKRHVIASKSQRR